ncbi:Alpha/Beta hydrolase protein [Pseudoneurospora amorphoporcata]|uniref:Alpha/Beta hydrolase protein n=1 Tax=Pseudoneurospora amorphoporcata TaxID=241081 RepID=A0AAN6NK40_9PEZI|nr:Alpha/Beta hydrolase protein [Pseudoneurospora amorphoporcata]
MSNHSGFSFNSSPAGPQTPIFSTASTPNARTVPSIGPRIPTVGPRARDLHYSIRDFLSAHPLLELGGQEHFTVERRRHQDVFGLHALPKDKIHPIDDVEFTAIRGPHGTIPIRVLYPASGKDSRNKGRAGALIYFHGGGYTVGSVDEFENGLRLVAEESGCQVYAVEYRLAPEFKYPVQLDEYSAVIDWVQGEGGKTRGVHPDKVLGGGDSAGGNMTAAICLRRMDEGRKPLAGQVLLYPEARLPFDTPAATENNSSLYLECNGIFSFASNYLPRSEDISPQDRYISPGMQSVQDLRGQPPAAVFTSGYDPLRDVGCEYANKLSQAGVQTRWRHYDNLTHGWLQMTAWSGAAEQAVKDVAQEVKRLAGAASNTPWSPQGQSQTWNSGDIKFAR